MDNMRIKKNYVVKMFKEKTSLSELRNEEIKFLAEDFLNSKPNISIFELMVYFDELESKKTSTKSDSVHKITIRTIAILTFIISTLYKNIPWNSIIEFLFQ